MSDEVYGRGPEKYTLAPAADREITPYKMSICVKDASATAAGVLLWLVLVPIGRWRLEHVARWDAPPKAKDDAGFCAS